MATGQTAQEEFEHEAISRVTQSGRENRRLEQIVRELQATGNASGRPLHQYRLDDVTLADLEHSLVARLREDGLRLTRAEAAAFVLYCAHHFTQTYTGGQWTWSAVLGIIDPSRRLESQKPALYNAIERGLQAWGRTVFWNGRYNEYLYTVGREGGLPLAVLAQEKREGLRTFLQRLLMRIETTTVPAEDAASELKSFLPVTLQQPEILLLAAELVRQVAAVRESVPAKTEAPIRWLDEHHPEWRAQLPLRTNEAVAAALISGLVQQERPKTRKQSFALVTQWVNGRLQRLLETPRQVTLQDLVGSNEDVALPTRVRIVLSNGHVQSVRAMAMRVGDDKYAIERLSSEPLSGSEWFSNEIRLIIGAGERELVNRPLAGGEATNVSPLPWVFDLDSDDRWILAARGSYSSKSERLLVVQQPSAAELQADPAVLEPLGTDPILGWTATWVAGSARWVGEEDTCVISALEVSNGVRFELRGHSEHLAGNGAFVWRGCPEVWSQSLHGSDVPPCRVPDNQVEWKPTGSDQRWQRVGQACLGEVQMRVCDGARTLYRSRFTVVPRDFRVELTATQTTEGVLRVIGAQLTGARVVTRGIEAAVRREPGRALIKVRTSTSPRPTDLDLEAEFGVAARLTVRVPFPSEFRGFVATDGQLLPKHGRIGLETLSRWIARVVSCETSQRYVLEARTSRGYRAIAELPSLSSGVSELPLSRIRAELESVLSGSRSIDTFVRLRISRETGEVVSASSRIEALLGWHETQLEVEPDGECAIVQISEDLRSGLEDWQLRDFRVLARPLHSPGAEPIALEGKATDGWFFSPAGERFWLLTGWVGNALITRPRLVNLANLQAPEPAAPASGDICLDGAMRVPMLDDRRAALARVYERLATDFSHEDWSRLDEFLHTLHELPPPTYDVVCALAVAKPAAIVALFRQPKQHFQSVWSGMERLGVSWQTIPFGLWLRAARLGQNFAFNSDYAAPVGGKERFLKACLPGLLEQLEHGPRFFQTLLAALNSYRAGFPDDPRGMGELRLAQHAHGRQILRGLIREACIELRRRVERTQERFPPVRVSGHECCPDIDAPLRTFGLSDQAAFTHECLAAPLVAADIMLNGRWVSSDFLDDLRLLRAFDEDWFDFAHAAALTVFLGEKLEKDDEFLERAESQVLRADG